ncbi:MAG: right-handed parallel beta-helix repeat-containing protein, partial [Actinomycetota bacterium]
MPFGPGRLRDLAWPRLSPRRAPWWIAVALPLLVPVAPSQAATYIVDGSSPDCSSSGPGTEAQPYCTIAAAVAAHHGPGTTILVKPGLYREQITIPASGASGSPFEFRALGASVVVDGSDDFSSAALWVPFLDDVHLAPSVDWNPLQVFLGGSRLTASGSDPASLPESTFRWIPGEGLYVNWADHDPGEVELLVGRRNYGFNMSGKSWITIEGFTIAHTESRGIYVNTGCSDIVIARDTVSYSNVYGIQAVNGQRVVIERCRTSDNNLHGIGLTAGSTACTVRSNESLRNADPSVRRANGIFLFGAPGNSIHGNRLHDNQDSGVHFGDGSNDCLSYNNRSWNNGDHGYDHLNVSGTIHIHDVAFGNYKDGFSIEDVSPNARLSNCIAIENGLATGGFDLWVNTQSMVGFVSDYNIFWNSTGQAPIKIGTTLYPTLAAYQGATGQDAHSAQADPRFVDGSGGDFHLMAGSPGIDTGTSGVPGWPPLDADAQVRVDDPATANAGDGPV